MMHSNLPLLHCFADIRSLEPATFIPEGLLLEQLDKNSRKTG